MLKHLTGAIAAVILLSGCVSGGPPDLVGAWSGTLDMGGAELRLVFHISESDGEYSTSIESVDQGGVMIPTRMEVNGTSLLFVVEPINVEYAAIVSGNEIVGLFTQGGMDMPNFTLRRNR